MRNNLKQLQKKYHGLIDQYLFTFKIHPRARTSYVEKDQNGIHTYCIQLEENTIKIENGSATVLKGFIRPLPTTHVSENRFVIGEDHTLRCFSGDNLEWETHFPRKRFGAGLGRGIIGQLEWSTDYIGFYEEKIEIRAMETIDWYGSGETHIVVLTSSGDLIVLNDQGKILEQKKIFKGDIRHADIVNISDTSNEWIININVNWVPRFIFFRKLMMEYLCLHYIQGKQVSRADKMAVLSKLKTDDNRFLTEDLDQVKLENGTFQKEVYGIRSLNDKQALCIDPRNTNRMLLASSNSASQRLQIKTIESEVLWEVDLPPTAGSDYTLLGCIGPENTSAEEYLAIACETERILQDHNINIRESHILVYDKCGKLIGKQLFAKSNDPYIVKCLLLDDIDGDGKIELIVFRDKSFTVYELPPQQEITLEQINKPDDYSMAQYPLPPEDLWTAGLNIK